MYQPRMQVTSAREIEAILGVPFPNQVNKVIDHLDDYCRAWIERTPFIVISSIGARDAMDASPKGDLPGFVKVLDRKTLAIPDRPGNRRGDTLRNVLDNPNVAMMFIIPRRREVVRVNGFASVVRDPRLLGEMAVNGKGPDLAIVVRVCEAFFHCGKSMIRSGLWDPERWGPVDGLPTYAEALKVHAASADTVDTIQTRIDHSDECLY